MNILILGGNNKAHYDWVRDLAKALKTDKNKTAFLDYKHWENGGEIDIQAEIESASEVARGMGDFVLVAKSVGTIISVLGIASGKLKPKACLLLGTPLSVIKDHNPEFAEAVKSLPRTTFLQNSHDPFGSSAELEEYLEDQFPDDYFVVESPGETHDYIDFASIKSLTNDLENR